MADQRQSVIIQLEDGWEHEIKARAIEPLTNMLDEGFRRELFNNKEYVRIYTTCYNMCTQRSPFNWSEQLYQRHGETIARYLEATVLPALREKHDQFLLEELVRRWNNHNLMNKWMKKFFMYLDRYYVKYHHLPTLEDAGMRNFKNLIFEGTKRDVINAVLDLVDQEREQMQIDQVLIKKCVELFEAMGMGNLDAYRSDFQEPLCASTREYYARKAEEWIQSDSTSAYLEKAERALEAERLRVSQYLHPETEADLLRVVEEELLERREMELLEKENSGCRYLLANDKVEDLSRMYRLFARLPDGQGLQPIADIVRQHILAMGNEKIDERVVRIEGGDKETNQDPQFIKDLLGVHDKFLDVVNSQFEGSSLFQRALKDAFVEIVNRDVGRFKNADLMSSFCDRLLKSGGERLSDTEVEEYLEKVVQLFSYLTDKDLFAEIYRNQLAKRLLNQRSSSDDLERSMVGKLKLRCGSQFTGKMEGMLNDLAIGSDHQRDFEAYLSERGVSFGRMEFSVQVLTTGYWPSYKAYDVTLPAEMVRCVNVFKEFYDDKTSHRRLAWMHSLGTATVRGTWGRRTYDFQLSTLQAVALLLFNGDAAAAAAEGGAAAGPAPLTLEAVRDELSIPDEAAKRVLHSLACGRYRVLRKEPDSQQIRAGDTFTVHPNFTCPKRKVQIPMASLEESHNPKRVEEDRTIAIEAAIVRIMKARKVCSHQQLVGEVLTQLSFFRPNPKVVKRRIEALIDREYLARNKDSPNVYSYLA